jgi:hypothetical protein
MIARLAVLPVVLGAVLGTTAVAGSAAAEAPAACTGTANPKSSQVCIATTGATPGRCEQANGYETAQVYLSPYIPGLNYVAKGAGCAGLATPSAAICSSWGPTSATL